ncbi:MAG: sodium:alanine symporter family protein [Oscillospiraceae bacterium]
MEHFVQTLNGIIWSDGMVLLILAAGIYLTFRTKFFQIRKFGHILSKTILSVFKSDKKKSQKGMSQFQVLSTALAATMGTGNIAGVATALTLGGAGAVFWLWVSALLGMIITYSENVLGIYYRYKDKDKKWVGGPMVYIEKGLGAKWLGGVYAALLLAASFGIGNLTQANSMAASLEVTFGVKPLVTGVLTAIIVLLVVIGGASRVGKVTEKVIPIISLAYIFAAILIIVINFRTIPTVFREIFSGAFGFDAAVGGFSGAIVRQAVTVGLRRGVFSNEAGLGSSAVVHAQAEDKEPVLQGMWAVFEVFVDTIICCTLTALAVLCSGVLDCKGESLDGAALVISAFSSGFGEFAGGFVSVSIVLFAFATLLGWSVYGSKAAEYLFGNKAAKFYKIAFVGAIIVGSVTKLEVVWGISDVLNGLMVVPNLVAVLLLSKKVVEITERYEKQL